MWRNQIQIFVFLFLIGICFVKQQVNASPLNFSVKVTVDSSYDYFLNKTVRISPLADFALNISLNLGTSWLHTTTSTEYQSTKSWLNLTGTLSSTPFTSQLLSVAGNVPLQYTNQSFARQVYTDYFDRNHYDASDRSLYVAEGFSYYDAQRRYFYWRGLTITSLIPMSNISDVTCFDHNSLLYFINDALSGTPNYTLNFYESGIWQDLTTFEWGPGYHYPATNVSVITPISEPLTFALLGIGLCGLVLAARRRRK